MYRHKYMPHALCPMSCVSCCMPCALYPPSAICPLPYPMCPGFPQLLLFWKRSDQQAGRGNTPQTPLRKPHSAVSSQAYACALVPSRQLCLGTHTTVPSAVRALQDSASDWTDVFFASPFKRSLRPSSPKKLRDTLSTDRALLAVRALERIVAPYNT